MPRDLNKRYTPTAEIGGAANYVEVESDGTLDVSLIVYGYHLR